MGITLLLTGRSKNEYIFQVKNIPISLIVAGYLYPVASWAVQMIKGLFAMNERVALVGEWEHGFFSYTPVGAYNVGTMTLNFEQVAELSSTYHLMYSRTLQHINNPRRPRLPLKKKSMKRKFHLRKEITLDFSTWDLLL